MNRSALSEENEHLTGRKADRDAIRTFYDSLWKVSPRHTDALRRIEADTDVFRTLPPADHAKSRVLDAACGTGVSLPFLEKRGYRPVALDLSREALLHIRRSQPRIPLVQGDIEALPFRSHSFDHALLFSALMFVDPRRTWTELLRVVRLRGTIQGVEPLAGNPFWGLYRLLRRKYRSLPRYLSWNAFLESLPPGLPPPEIKGYYLFPVTILLKGRLRSFFFSCEQTLLTVFPFLSRFCWMLRFRIFTSPPSPHS